MCERYARKPDMHTKTVAQKRGKEDYEEKVIVGNMREFPFHGFAVDLNQELVARAQGLV